MIEECGRVRVRKSWVGNGWSGKKAAPAVGSDAVAKQCAADGSGRVCPAWWEQWRKIGGKVTGGREVGKEEGAAEIVGGRKFRDGSK